MEGNYKAYAKYINEDVYSTSFNRDKLLKPPHSVTSAIWFSKIHTKTAFFSAIDDFNKVTLTVNGGLNGYNDRLDFLRRGIESLKASHLIQLYHNKCYVFEQSDIYNSKLGALAWGIWHDPHSKRTGVQKSKNEAFKGYLRTKCLIEANPLTDKEKAKRWYGVLGNDLLIYINDRISTLNGVKR
ncbi:hypothetical protein ABK905_00375 [Acerihabitans sp. KWT182]|uniref:Uncharacterized protein n=1 Tax=Acerihabitans sp. KWT182 TaxID=3157919 RepID=A0AAU7QAI3_9GAMM